MKGKMLSIGEVTKASGVSARALHFYDEKGLLKPSFVSEAGYRYYDSEALGRLKRLLLLRELDIPLSQIKSVLDNKEDSTELLEKQRLVLLAKAERLRGLAESIARMIKGEDNMSFEEFSTEKIDRALEEYAKEAKKRWGETEEYKQSEEKAKGRTKQDSELEERERNEIFSAFAALNEQSPDSYESDEAKETVERWREHISRYYYDCTREILSCLGQMYTADERFTENLDSFGRGTALYMSRAIESYCK